MWTSAPRLCMTVALAKTVITCLVPTNAPALMVTEKLGPNAWVSSESGFPSSCFVTLV